MTKRVLNVGEAVQNVDGITPPLISNSVLPVLPSIVRFKMSSTTEVLPVASVTRSGISPWFRRSPETRSRRAGLSIRKFEQKCSGFSGQQLRDHVCRISEQIASKGPGNQGIVELAGVVAEAVHRKFGFRLHDVQLQAIAAGCNSSVVEMQTGEGKTVVTGSIAAIKALTLGSVHVATTNAYLAARDLEELEPVFESLGLSSALLPEGNNPEEARSAYGKQITYGPGYQFGFDYLRDQVFLRGNRQSRLGIQTLNAIRGIDPGRSLMQHTPRHAMLVDEADCVMVDEAVTPLVISGGARDSEDPFPFDLARKIAGKLKLDEDFAIELPQQSIEVNDHAMARCHEDVANQNNLDLQRPWRVYISNALRAEHVLKRDVDYVVLEGEVQIVDQYTGRIFSDRTWQDGLHQAVESRERVEIKSAPPAVARITRQRYMLMYDELAGLTGTATDVAQEFKDVYGVSVMPVRTNLPCLRKNQRARFFRDQDAKLDAVAKEVDSRHRTGQPILIGTRTINESLMVADKLKVCGIPATVLNGIQDQEEAEIVSKAGTFGTVTIATNMAGRGTDIKPDSRSIEAGGLHVIGFSPNASTRIDRQLIGRTARQGNPGTSRFFIAADDEFIAIHSAPLSKRIVRNAHKSGEATKDFSAELLAVQRANEVRQAKSREALLRSDHWMDLVRESIEKE